MSLNSLLSEAKARFDEGDIASALQGSAAAVETAEGKRSFLAWTFRAHCASAINEYAIAVDALVKATELQAPPPQHQKNWKNLADLYEKLGKWSDHASATIKLKGNFERGCALATTISESYTKTSHYEAHGTFLVQHLSRCNGQYVEHELPLLERLCALIKSYREEKLRENKMSIGRNVAATMEAQLHDNASWCSLSQVLTLCRFYYPYTSGFTTPAIIAILQLILHGVYNKNIMTDPKTVYDSVLEMHSLISPSVDASVLMNLSVILTQVFVLLPNQSYDEIASYVDRQLASSSRPIFLSLQVLRLIESECLTSALQLMPKLEKYWQQLFASITPAAASTEHAPPTSLSASQLLLSAAEETVCLWVAVLLGAFVAYDGWTIAHALHATHEAYRRVSILPFSVRTSICKFLPMCRATAFAKISCTVEAEKIMLLESNKVQSPLFWYLAIENLIALRHYERVNLVINSLSAETQNNEFICVQKIWCKLLSVEDVPCFSDRKEDATYAKFAQAFSTVLSKENASITLFRRGIALWLSGGTHRKTEAAPCFVNAAKINAYCSDVYMFLGHCYRPTDCNTSQRCYLKALMLNPCNHESGLALTKIYMSLQDTPKMLKLWSDISSTCAYAEWSYTLAGKYYMSICDYDRAIAMFQKSLELVESADVWYRTAKCFIYQLQFVAAYKSLLSAYALDASDVILVDIGYVEKQLCLLHEAIERFSAVLKRNDKDALCYYYAADTLHAMAYQQYTTGWTQGTARSVLQGVKYAEEAIRLGLKELCVYKVLGDLCCLAKFFGPFDYHNATQSGDVDSYSGMQLLLDKALDAYDCALNMLQESNIAEKEAILSDMEYDIGAVLYYKTQFGLLQRGQGTALLPVHLMLTSEDKTRLALACDHFVKSLEYNPQNSRAWNARGLVTADVVAKEMCYVRATQIDNNPSAYENLCLLMMKHGQDAKARECLTALQLIESNPLHWVYVGMLLERDGQSKEMIYDGYTAALEIAKPCEALFGSAVAYLSMHDYFSGTATLRTAQDIIDVRYEVEYKLRRVVLLRPMQVHAWILLSNCLLLREAFDEAERCLCRAMKALDNCYEFIFNLQDATMKEDGITRVALLLRVIVTTINMLCESLGTVNTVLDTLKLSKAAQDLGIECASDVSRSNPILHAISLDMEGQYTSCVTCLRELLSSDSLHLVLRFLRRSNGSKSIEIEDFKNEIAGDVIKQCFDGTDGRYANLIASSPESCAAMAEFLLTRNEVDKAKIVLQRGLEHHSSSVKLRLLLCRLDAQLSVEDVDECVTACYAQLWPGEYGCVHQYSESVVLQTQAHIHATKRTNSVSRRHILQAIHMDPTNIALWHSHASAMYSDMVLGQHINNIAEIVEDGTAMPNDINVGTLSDASYATLCADILRCFQLNSDDIILDADASDGLKRARKCVLLQQWDSAIDAYKTLLGENSSEKCRRRYWLELGNVYSQMLMPQSAEACYTSAAQDSSEVLSQYTGMLKAVAYFNKGATSGEYKWIEKAKTIASSESTAAAHALKAAMWIHAGKLSKAKACYVDAFSGWKYVAFPFVFPRK